MKNQAQLIAYVDRFPGGTFRDLRLLLEGPLRGAFGGVHVLPFFHPIDGADAGFDPIDHTQVDPRLGTWDDVAALAAQTDVMADVIVNHVSRHSPQFVDYDQRGEDSPYAGMFLTYDRVFPNGAHEADILAIYRNYDFQTKVLVASVRHPVHVLEAARLGADVATIPFGVIEQLAKHPLTDSGLKKFLADWEKVPKP